MNYLVVVILFVISSSVMGSADSKHMVSFGQGGLGGSWSYEKMETERNSPYSDVNFSLGNLSLNYAYRLGSRFQIGGFYESTHSKYKFKQSDGNEFAKMDTEVMGLFGIYNFSKKINESYNIGISLSTFTIEEENSHGINEAESKAPFELDDTGFTYEISFGKRFSIEPWGIKHLTYSPALYVYYRTHGRDFNDQKVDDGLGLTIQAIKFDLLI